MDRRGEPGNFESSRCKILDCFPPVFNKDYPKTISLVYCGEMDFSVQQVVIDCYLYQGLMFELITFPTHSNPRSL